jgi:ADP-heptose:LPS heptosyltransferase
MRFNLGRYRVEHIDKHRKGRRQITSASHKELVQQPTSFQNYLEVFAKLGYPVDIKFKSIFPDEGGNLNMLPAGMCVKKSYEQWIGVAPFAAHEGKTYPPRLMHQVIEQLINKYPKARIFLFGRGEQETQYFTEWSQQHSACVNVGEQLESMHQELILMSHLDVMISMDSSNMHMASLTNTPVISVWGATHPYAGFMGWGQSEENAVQIPLDCRPCSIFGQKPCLRGDYACMRNIAPEAIVEKVEKVLKRAEP